MFFDRRFLICLGLCLVCAAVQNTTAAEHHNSTRSNRGSIAGGGSDGTGGGEASISNDKIVRKRPGRTTYSNTLQESDADLESWLDYLDLILMTESAEGTERDASIGNDKIVRKRPGRTTYSNAVSTSESGR